MSMKYAKKTQNISQVLQAIVLLTYQCMRITHVPQMVLKVVIVQIILIMEVVITVLMAVAIALMMVV